MLSEIIVRRPSPICHPSRIACYRDAMSTIPAASTLQSALLADGFAFVGAAAMQQLLEVSSLGDWKAFAESWNDLPTDSYLAATGRQRRRRHGTFAINLEGSIRREPHQPHFQNLKNNALQGDMLRWFVPIQPAVADGESLQNIIGFGHALFAPLAGRPRFWHVEAHQFRIEARAGEAGEPTPEGVHRDGVDYVLVLLIDRENIESGTTTIHDDDDHLLGSFTLIHPLDAALVIDARVSHGVTPVTALDPAKPSHRDVLVVTYQASGAAGSTNLSDS